MGDNRSNKVGGATKFKTAMHMPTRSALLVGSLLFLIIIFALSLQLWSSRGERILWHSPSQVEGLVSDSTTRSRWEYSAGIPESSTVPADISNDTERTWRLKRLGRRSAPSHKLTATQANSEASLKSLKLNSTSNTTIPRVSLLPPSLNLDQNPDVVPRSEEGPLRLYAVTADPPSGCHEAHCMEYLTESEKQTVKNCDDKVYKRYNRTPDDGTCSFIDGQERLPVALVGSQGSGNTWVRHILERTTGICTGHSTCDYMTRVLGFIGEGVKSGNVLVVETHDSSPRWNQNYMAYRKANAVLGFGSAIYIVKNPYYSAIAEWNRLTTSNILRNESRITPRKHLGELNTINNYCIASLLISDSLVPRLHCPAFFRT